MAGVRATLASSPLSPSIKDTISIKRDFWGEQLYLSKYNLIWLNFLRECLVKRSIGLASLHQLDMGRVPDMSFGYIQVLNKR